MRRGDTRSPFFLYRLSWVWGIVDRGLSGDVDQSTADAAITLTFKNGIPSKCPCDDVHVQDWYSLVTQLSVMQHPPIRENPHIIDLVGIGWKVDASGLRAWPFLVTPKVNRGSLADFLLQEKIEDEVRFQICSQVAEACALLHRVQLLGIWHLQLHQTFPSQPKEGYILHALFSSWFLPSVAHIFGIGGKRKIRHERPPLPDRHIKLSVKVNT